MRVVRNESRLFSGDVVVASCRVPLSKLTDEKAASKKDAKEVSGGEMKEFSRSTQSTQRMIRQCRTRSTTRGTTYTRRKKKQAQAEEKKADPIVSMSTGGTRKLRRLLGQN